MARNILLNEEKEGKLIEVDKIKRVYVRRDHDLDDCFISESVLKRLEENKSVSILNTLQNLNIFEVMEALDEIEVFPKTKAIIEKLYASELPLGVLKVLSFSKHSFTFKDIYFPGFIEIVKTAEDYKPKNLVYLAIFREYRLFYNTKNNTYEAYLNNKKVLGETSFKRLIIRCTRNKNVIVIDEQKLDVEEIENRSKNPRVKEFLEDTLSNFNIELNDSAKLIVSHMPKIELSGNVIEIPEAVNTEYILSVGKEIDLGNLLLVAREIKPRKVYMEVISTKSIIKEDECRLKKGEILELDFKNIYNLRLKSKKYQETWDLSLARSTFDKELRFIDFHKIVNKINELDYVKEYTELERLETEKAIILFLHLVMQNSDYDALDELYKILSKDTKLYEEYITDYTLNKSMELKDSLETYEEKKRFLTKARFVETLVKANYLNYPRYIYDSMNYFSDDEVMKSFKEEKSLRLSEKAFKEYLVKLFEHHDYYEDLSSEEQQKLDKALQRLSIIFKNNFEEGENIKYTIEEALYEKVLVEELSFIISKILLKHTLNQDDYHIADKKIKNLYLRGELKIPFFIEEKGALL